MGWYKEYLQDLEDIARERAANRGCAWLIIIAIIIGIPLCIGFYVKDHYFEYSEEEKIAYAIGAHIANPKLDPMKRVLASFNKTTKGEPLSQQQFNDGFYNGFHNSHIMNSYPLDLRENAYKFYKQKRRKKNLEHNKAVSYDYGHCYGAVINIVLRKYQINKQAFTRGAEDHYSFPSHSRDEIKYPKDSIAAILARHKDVVDNFTHDALGQCNLF